jgi:hypothetical protein
MPWGCVDLTEEAQFIMSAFQGAAVRVLDVGVGFGSFGLAYRSAQLRAGALIPKEQWNSHADLMDPAKWAGVLDGIDIVDYSTSPAWRFYNTIHVGEAIETLRGMADASYDVVVANDVIEHFDSQTVGVFAGEIQRVARSAVIVGYPLTVQEVSDEGAEQHRVIVDPQTVLNGFTHRVNLVDGWAISFKLLGRIRPLKANGV